MLDKCPTKIGFIGRKMVYPCGLIMYCTTNVNKPAQPMEKVENVRLRQVSLYIPPRIY